MDISTMADSVIKAVIFAGLKVVAKIEYSERIALDATKTLGNRTLGYTIEYYYNTCLLEIQTHESINNDIMRAVYEDVVTQEDIANVIVTFIKEVEVKCENNTSMESAGDGLKLRCNVENAAGVNLKVWTYYKNIAHLTLAVRVKLFTKNNELLLRCFVKDRQAGSIKDLGQTRFFIKGEEDIVSYVERVLQDVISEEYTITKTGTALCSCPKCGGVVDNTGFCLTGSCDYVNFEYREEW